MLLSGFKVDFGSGWVGVGLICGLCAVALGLLQAVVM